MKSLTALSAGGTDEHDVSGSGAVSRLRLHLRVTPELDPLANNWTLIAAPRSVRA